MSQSFIDRSATPYITASHAGLSPLSLDDRCVIWGSVGAGPALTRVAGLFRALDLKMNPADRLSVDRSFIDPIEHQLKNRLLGMLEHGRPVFSNTGLLQCMKEIIEYADEYSSVKLSHDDLTRCVLSCQQEQDIVDDDMAARVVHPETTTPELFMHDFTEMAVEWVAQQLFDYLEPFEVLACSVHETWRSGWAPGTKSAVVRDLGSGPSDAFAGVFGVPLDDFLSLAWSFMNLARHDGRVRYGLELLRDLGATEQLVNVFLDCCALPLRELRRRLEDERCSGVPTTWARYLLQEFPFVIMDDGTFIMLRLQFAIQRMFGDVLYLKVHDKIKAADTGRASRFKAAMNSIFEYRVGQTLKRIAKSETWIGSTNIIEEGQLNAAWKNRRAEHPKICDFVYAQGDRAILIDANNRHLPKMFADRRAAGEDLRSEIRNMFAATKFEQLLSTVRQFRLRGWNRGSVGIGPETRYLPFVVAPNAGMQSNAFTEMLILIEALPMIAEFDSHALPPSIMTWRDLQLLEALAEQTVDLKVVDILTQWRIFNYLVVHQRRGMPVSFETHLASRCVNGLPNLSQHESMVGAKLFEELRWHAARMLVTST
jgi:hypothetical protein